MISAVILAKNEESNIEECLKTVSWCDEIIVIDDNSTDKTIPLAGKLGANVFHHQLVNFASQRNYALEQVKKEGWVLFVDADERVSKALEQEIKQVITQESDVDGYFLRRQDVLWGKTLKHGETAHIRLLRLGRKHVGKWKGKVHETWEINGKTAEFSNPLMHYPHQSISEFLSKINQYSDMRSQELYEEGVRTNAFLIILYPKAKFIVNYFMRLGFLDGIPGLVHAIMMSMHSFVARGKLWLLWQRRASL